MAEAFELRSNHDDTKMDVGSVSDSVPMLNDVTKIPTSRAVYAVQSALNTKIEERTEFWVDGVQKQARKAALLTGTVSGGNVVFYPTDDGTATGNALFTTIYSSYIFPKGSSTTADYLFGVPTIAGNKKSITIAVTQITQVLVLTLATAANGAVINVVVYGE